MSADLEGMVRVVCFTALVGLLVWGLIEGRIEQTLFFAIVAVLAGYLLSGRAALLVRRVLGS
ncbi:MAG: hypothetical protein QXU26_02670 [Thermofilaceae archaeon]